MDFRKYSAFLQNPARHNASLKLSPAYLQSRHALRIQDLPEMTPNQRQSICCGGGGGLVALPSYDEARLAAGEPKAKQIPATGAEAVVASCDNCRLQIGQLNEHYKLNVNVVGLSELVANATVPRKKGASSEERTLINSYLFPFYMIF